MDLVGPYWTPPADIWNALPGIVMRNWSIETEGDTLRHKIEVVWPDTEVGDGSWEGPLRLAFYGAQCLGERVFICDADGCELRP